MGKIHQINIKNRTYYFYNDQMYLVLDDVDENKEVSKKYDEVWEGVTKEFETVNGSEKVNSGKIFKKLGLTLMMTWHSINP